MDWSDNGKKVVLSSLLGLGLARVELGRYHKVINQVNANRIVNRLNEDGRLATHFDLT